MKLGNAEEASGSRITHPSDPWTKLETCSTWLNKCHSTWISKILKPILLQVGNRRIRTIEGLLADDLVQMPPCRGAGVVGKCYQFHVLHHFLHQSSLSNCCVWTPRGWINQSSQGLGCQPHHLQPAQEQGNTCSSLYIPFFRVPFSEAFGTTSTTGARGGPGKWSALAYITDSERYTCHTYQEISCNHRKKLGVFMENHPVFLQWCLDHNLRLRLMDDWNRKPYKHGSTKICQGPRT